MRSTHMPKFILRIEKKRSLLDCIFVCLYLFGRKPTSPLITPQSDKIHLLKSQHKHPYVRYISVMFWPFDPAKNAIRGDALEGSDTF